MYPFEGVVLNDKERVDGVTAQESSEFKVLN
jgi:hypothetical protein